MKTRYMIASLAVPFLTVGILFSVFSSHDYWKAEPRKADTASSHRAEPEKRPANRDTNLPPTASGSSPSAASVEASAAASPLQDAPSLKDIEKSPGAADRTVTDDPSSPSRQERNQSFEKEALSLFPLHTVETLDSPKPSRLKPPEGEIWIRIKASNASEMKKVMEEVAELYKKNIRYDKPVTVINWVGNRPWAKIQYPSEIQ